jgi:hypothetical protein
MPKMKEETPAVMAVVLKDGSHQLRTPGWTEIEYVQDRGYPINVFARSSDRVEDVVAEAIREARIAASMAVPPADPTNRRVVWTPEQVIEAVSAINPSVGAVMDYGSIRTHLAALLVASEPTEGWTDARVMEAMLPANIYTYAKALQVLYNAAFPRSAASSAVGEG